MKLLRNIECQLGIIAFLVLCTIPCNTFAYIGPGAGFAVISSFFIFFLTGFLVFVTIITWPIRALVLFFKRRKIQKRSKVKRVIIIGFDGLDPGLCKRYMDDGLLPNFSSLKEQGTFKSLHTTTPSISPVAWSSFATGVNPGKHRIFDFYTRNPATYMPVLSSVHISSSVKVLKWLGIKIPWRRTMVSLLRKSRSFWKILGDYGIFTYVHRVPITFPPEKFSGACLAAMCTPDLLGTQGSYTQLTTEIQSREEITTGGRKIPIQLRNNEFVCTIPGPLFEKNGSKHSLSVAFHGQINYEQKSIQCTLGDVSLLLEQGKYSPWIKIPFKVNTWKKITGIVRILVTELHPQVKIYFTPINLDPEKPNLPISHPFYYAVILAKLYGPYASLGLAEDTWALNDDVISEEAFLEQSYDIFQERKRQLMDCLKKKVDGVVVSVFDTSDRIQHMFFRYLDADHPANQQRTVTVNNNEIIPQLYKKMDDLVGEIRQQMQPHDVLIILSDHGFKQFKWGINLNTWLWRKGYLVFKDDCPDKKEWFYGVDWSRTRAYAYGLSGIFLNITGRESQGTIKPGKQRLQVQREIVKQLESLWDEQNRQKPINRLFLSQEVFKGPYINDAPDILVGFADGYRVSWNSAIGKVSDSIIEANTRRWSGDHSLDPALVPGVFFSNREFLNENPSIQDIAPTIVDFFGIASQPFHDGKILTMKAAK